MAISTASRSAATANLKGWIPNLVDGPRLFDTTTFTAHELQAQLTAGKISSTEILNEYYRHIIKHNGYLNGVYELAPGALQRAQELDAKRAKGEYLGPLHGIPVLIKDNIDTHPSLGMGTTAGAAAMVGSKPKRNAPIIEQLLNAGAVIFAKATLSEYAWFRDFGIRCGWSVLAGQGQNPYIKGGLDMKDGLGGHSSPGGSSSGSGISVAAGMAPLAIGTETEGSLVSPSTRNSLYTVKPTLGIVSNEGILPVSARFDTAGPMCTNVKDVADLLTTLVDPTKTIVPEGGYASAIRGAEGWKDLRIGTLDPEKWHYDESLQKSVPEATKQITAVTKEAYTRIKSLAKAYHDDISLRPDKDFDLDGQNALFTLMIADFKEDMDRYLTGLDDLKCKTLEEIVEYNKEHFKEALTDEYPNQGVLEASLAFGDSVEKREKLLKHIREVGKSFLETLAKYNIDVIIGPGDSWLSKYSAALGGPLAAMPLTYIGFNGRPVGLMAAAPEHHEATLIKLISAFESSFPARMPPKAYLNEARAN